MSESNTRAEIIEVMARGMCGPGIPCEACRLSADRALTALEASGRAVVPREPTDKMFAAAFKVEREPKPIIGYRRIGAVYAAMLAAALPTRSEQIGIGSRPPVCRFSRTLIEGEQ